MNQPEIIMYVRPDCADVALAQEVLRAHRLRWEEIDIEQDAAARRRVEDLTGRAATPTLRLGDRILVEPSSGELEEALRQEIP